MIIVIFNPTFVSHISPQLLTLPYKLGWLCELCQVRTYFLAINQLLQVGNNIFLKTSYFRFSCCFYFYHKFPKNFLECEIHYWLICSAIMAFPLFCDFLLHSVTSISFGTYWVMKAYKYVVIISNIFKFYINFRFKSTW
jgi:hypothetical protein